MPALSYQALERARAWSEDHGSTAYASSPLFAILSLCVPPSVPVRRHPLPVPPPITMSAFADSCLCLALPRSIHAEFEGTGAVLGATDAMIKRPRGPPCGTPEVKEKEKNDRSHLHVATSSLSSRSSRWLLRSYRPFPHAMLKTIAHFANDGERTQNVISFLSFLSFLYEIKFGYFRNAISYFQIEFHQWNRFASSLIMDPVLDITDHIYLMWK